MPQVLLQVRMTNPEQKHALEAFETVNINTDSVDSIRLTINKLFDKLVQDVPLLKVDNNLKPVALSNFINSLTALTYQTNSIDIKGMSRTDPDGHIHSYISIIPKRSTNG
jgi:hypothetical protein